MKEKLIAIKNKFLSQMKNEKIVSIYKKIYKLTIYLYEQIYKATTFCAKKLADKGISANFISIFGFVVGILALNFISMEMYATALLCILINRWFDALDGAVAKLSSPNKFGIFLDAVLDYMFYGAVIFGFALANPQENAIAAAFLLFAFCAAACSLLAYAIIAYKENIVKESPFYLGGFAQGAETFIALIILCLVPGWFMPIAIVLGILCLIKAFSVISTAYYNFVISEKSKK